MAQKPIPKCVACSKSVGIFFFLFRSNKKICSIVLHSFPLPCCATANKMSAIQLGYFYLHCLCKSHSPDKLTTLMNNSYFKREKEERNVFRKVIFIMESVDLICVLSWFSKKISLDFPKPYF